MTMHIPQCGTKCTFDKINKIAYFTRFFINLSNHINSLWAKMSQIKNKIRGPILGIFASKKDTFK